MMRPIHAALVPLLLLWPGSGLTAQSTDAGTLIRNARLAQNQAIIARAWDSVASFWVQDVAVVTGLGLPLQGREAYLAGFAADREVVYERTPGSIRVSSHWPLAWEEGTWTARRAQGVAAPLVSGRYSAQWIRASGRWLIRSEVFVALDCSGEACNWPASTPAQ